MVNSPSSVHQEYQPVRAPRIFEQITAQLRKRVIHGHLKPGDRLPPERELAEKLGVSRSTVREALRVLEIAGVLRLQKGASGGAFVVAPNGDVLTTALQDMFQLGSITPAELTEARLALEATVIRFACERITEDGLTQLERNVEESLKASKAGELAQRSAINLEFHNILARTTGNPVFAAMIGGVIAVMQHFVDTLGPPTGDEVFKSRRRFIAHLRARRADAAIDEMAGFLSGVHRQYLSRLELKRPAPAKPAKAARRSASAKGAKRAAPAKDAKSVAPANGAKQAAPADGVRQAAPVIGARA